MNSSAATSKKTMIVQQAFQSRLIGL